MNHVTDWLPHVATLQPGKVVILLSGRYAGKKAMIVKNYDDGTSSRPYGHALVCGLAKEPRKVRQADGLRCRPANRRGGDVETRWWRTGMGCELVAAGRGSGAQRNALRLLCTRSGPATRSGGCRPTPPAPNLLQVIKRSSQKTQARRSSMKVRSGSGNAGKAGRVHSRPPAVLALCMPGMLAAAEGFASL